ncbi:hypothetical protein [Magnetovibrio blakemorei]|uniref:hypothetical protein n=1 Tax=Magnetovibrio blakemorei TaxID=28181 RepID=UPI001112CCE6|nr:hypothetical protein [Magnetovibrio blakemorei]
MNILKRMSGMALVGLSLSACQTMTPYEAASPLGHITVAFADAAWTGKDVPKDGICKRNGGNGNAPMLALSDVPDGTNAVIVKFSDRSYQPNNNGGHGTIGYWVTPSQGSVTLPSVPETTTTGLPEGTWKEGKVYAGPCSGGRGNIYEADVYAVHKDKTNEKLSRTLATGLIRLGRF